jgi:hypothetical protein
MEEMMGGMDSEEDEKDGDYYEDMLDMLDDADDIMLGDLAIAPEVAMMMGMCGLCNYNYVGV